MAYREKDTKKWTAQWFETNVMGEKKKRRKRGFEIKREALEFERSKQAAKQIADLEREIEQRKQSREYRSIADKIKANRGTINQRDRQQEKSRRRSRGMEI